MSQKNNFSEMDPEIASLLEDSSSTDAPNFDDLMAGTDSNEEETIKDSFPQITTKAQKPQPYFNDKNYYKSILTGVEDSARLHEGLAKYLKADDPQDKTAFRMRLISSYWLFLRKLVRQLGPSISMPKRMCIRFGMLLPSLVTADQREMLSKAIFENKWGEPVHYVDEWLQLVAMGDAVPLATDETRIPDKNKNSKLRHQFEKAKGSENANKTIIKKLQSQFMNLQQSLEEKCTIVTQKQSNVNHPDLQAPVSTQQKSAIKQIQEICSQLNKLERNLATNFEKFQEAHNNKRDLEHKMNELGEDTTVDLSVISDEMGTVQNLCKLSVGRQGNHFPFLMKSFFTPQMQYMATRENVLEMMDYVEKIDGLVFKRSYRQSLHRIVPHTIILPCYGEKGICWEPFEKYNRGTSRGRIGVPLFPKNLKAAVVYALGDLKWQVAKEKAAHYWMEEGITGHYYQWFNDKKYRGDVKERFLEDYYLWITKESEGMQKLDKDVRGIFWRDAPFPEELRERLRNRGYVYNELYKKDLNRARSDGY